MEPHGMYMRLQYELSKSHRNLTLSVSVLQVMCYLTDIAYQGSIDLVNYLPCALYLCMYVGSGMLCTFYFSSSLVLMLPLWPGISPFGGFCVPLLPKRTFSNVGFVLWHGYSLMSFVCRFMYSWKCRGSWMTCFSLFLFLSFVLRIEQDTEWWLGAW